MKDLLTIAIPTYNNGQQLQWCLRSLFQYTDFPFHVVVVNNYQPGGESLKAAVEVTPSGGRLSLLEMGYNAGWMGGINAALAQCETEYFCMMNDDVMFIPASGPFWRNLVNMLQNPKVGAVGPCSNFVAGAQSLMATEVPPAVETTLLIGLCLVMRTADLKALGGLDATLPGGDDLDLSIRVRKSGKALAILKDCYLHHFGQQTGKRVHGADWDSRQHQEATNNALIRKHGVGAWYETFSAAWAPVAPPPGRFSADNEWLPGKMEKYKGWGRGLDLGCGPNKRAFEGVGVTAVDQDGPEDASVGGRLTKGANPDLQADATDLPLEAGSQDFIIASHLLEHLVDTMGALREWKRVLKPGGELFVMVPDQDLVPGILLDCSHVHAFNQKTLREVVDLTGFFVKECRTIDWGVVVLHAVKPEEAA